MADPTCLDELFPFLDHKVQEKVESLYKESDKIECDHNHHFIHHGLKICGDCGTLIDQITYEKDWRSYGNASSRGTQESAKTRRRSRTISKELVQLGFSQNVAEIADKYYQEITKPPDENHIGKRRIFRSNNRNALMAVCAFFAHIDVGEPRSSKEIMNKFSDLEQRKFNDQLDQFFEKYPDKRTTYVEPKHLVSIVLKKVGILEARHFRRVRALCAYLGDTTDLMKSSKPESIAAAIVYLHLCMNPLIKEELALSKTKFAEKVNLSDATIDKLVKDAAATLGNDVKVI